MTTDDTRALVARLLHRIAPEVDLDRLDPAAPLQTEADLDSMDFLNLMTAIYDETGIDIPERDYPDVATLDALADRVDAGRSPAR